MTAGPRAPDPPPGGQSDAPLTAAEAAEFARALGVRVAAIRSTYTVLEDGAPDPETYDQLVADPIKNFVATNNYEFFVQVKCDLVWRFAHRAFPATAPNLRVLDIGCGTGAMLRVLAQRFREVRGCDPAQSMVVRAGPAAVHMPDPTHLPFTDGYFDIALSACVYHHIALERRAAHVADVHRVLRPGGLFLIFEHNPYNPLTRLIVRRCPLDENAQLLAGVETKRMLQSAGFDAVRNRYYLFLPKAIYRRLSFLEALLSFTALGGQYCTVGQRRP